MVSPICGHDSGIPNPTIHLVDPRSVFYVDDDDVYADTGEKGDKAPKLVGPNGKLVVAASFGNHSRLALCPPRRLPRKKTREASENNEKRIDKGCSRQFERRESSLVTSKDSFTRSGS